jgi:hypothetical protein
MLRHLIAVLIVVFFGVMMTSLMRRHVLPTLDRAGGIRLSPSALAEEWAGRDEWTALQVGGRKVGALRTVVQAAEGGRAGYDGFLKFALDGNPAPATLESAARLNERLEIEQIVVQARLAGTEQPALELAGLVQGRQLLVRLSSPTGVKYQQLELPRPITMNFAADPFMASGMLEPGKTYSLDVYDPLWGMQAGRLKMTLAGTRRLHWRGQTFESRIVEAEMGTVKSRIWLDWRGDPLRREIMVPLGAGGARAQEGDGAAQLTVMLERIDEPEEMIRHAELRTLPPVPDLLPADMRGENTGEPLQSLGLLPLLMKGSLVGMLDRAP